MMLILRYVWGEYTDFMQEHKKSEAEVYLYILALGVIILMFFSADTFTAISSGFLTYVLPKYGMAIWSWYKTKKDDFDY